MHIVLLRFTERKSDAGKFMAGHKDWIQEGFDGGLFLLAGSLQSQAGGVLLANGIPAEELDQFIRRDPFVEHGIVTPEIIAVAPSRVDERLGFLLGQER